MPHFEFVSDRNSPNHYSAGEFTPHADQSKFSSIWAKVDGEGSGFFTAHHVQQGIYSADGRARLHAEEYRDANDKPHEIKVNKATLREFIVPREDVAAWNAYEGAQGSKKEQEFRTSYEAKMRARGVIPQASDITDEYVELRAPEEVGQPGQSTTVSMHVHAPPPRRGPGRPPKAQAAPPVS
jgi:hypothetical protein